MYSFLLFFGCTLLLLLAMARGRWLKYWDLVDPDNSGVVDLNDVDKMEQVSNFVNKTLMVTLTYTKVFTGVLKANTPAIKCSP
jgi:hypothetical protein